MSNLYRYLSGTEHMGIKILNLGLYIMQASLKEIPRRAVPQGPEMYRDMTNPLGVWCLKSCSILWFMSKRCTCKRLTVS